MRKSYNGDFLYRKKHKIFMGLNFGADFCAEHEWGIKGIKYIFGIPDTGYGLDKKKITKVPKTLEWFSLGKVEGFWINRYQYDVKERIPKGNGLYTAWGENDFLICSNDPTDINRLRELYESILKLDLCIWLGGGGVFENAGFVLCKASSIAKETIVAWEKADKDQEQLLTDVINTGIEKRLREAGLKYFALSPSRKQDGSLSFWLNPYDQEKCYLGPVTLKDLEDWIAGKGKIPNGAGKD